MSLSTDTTFVGVNRRLDGFAGRSDHAWPEAQVRVKYEDADGDACYVHICASGARLLAKALNKAAKAIEDGSL